MGSSNSTAISNYINNSIEINNAVSSSVKAGSTISFNSQAKNIVDFSAGDKECCEAFSKSITKTSEMSDAVFKSLTDAQTVKYHDCISQSQPVVTCNLNITQTGSSKVRISSDVTTKSNIDLINSVISHLKNDLNDMVNQTNDTGIFSDAFGSDNNVAVVNRVVNSFKSTLSVDLNVEVQSNIRSVSGQTNHAKISFCTGTFNGNDCTVTQDVSIDTYVKNIVGAISNAAIKNTEIQEFTTAIKTSVKQKNTNWLSDFMEDISIAEKAVIILIIGSVIIALVFGLVIIMRRLNHHTGNDYSIRDRGYDDYRGGGRGYDDYPHLR